MTIILGIKILNRDANTIEVQKILTEEGCNIKTRLGLHDVDENSCSPAGVIILQIFGEVEAAECIKNKLDILTGVSSKIMVLD